MSTKDSNAADLGHYLLAADPSTKPAAKKRKRAKAKSCGGRENTTRKRCKESIPIYEARLLAATEETVAVEKELRLKHSNLAGHHGKRFDVKVLAFSKEQEKTSGHSTLLSKDQYVYELVTDVVIPSQWEAYKANKKLQVELTRDNPTVK